MIMKMDETGKAKEGDVYVQIEAEMEMETETEDTASHVQELKAISLGQGCHLRIFVDHGARSDSPDYRYTEMVYDGEPESQVFEVPSHWHKYHDEIMVVTEGEIDMTVEGVTTRVKAGDEPIRINRRQVHSLKFVPGVRSVLRERTDPPGEFKEWFFRDLFEFGDSPSILHVMRAFWDSDVYMALPVRSQILDQAFVYVCGGIAKIIGSSRKPLPYEPWPVPQEDNAKVDL